MKNSSLIVLILAIIAYTFLSIITKGILPAGTIVAYLIICSIEINEPAYLNLIPKKYNLVDKFVKWVDSLPQIIKNKEDGK